MRASRTSSPPCPRASARRSARSARRRVAGLEIVHLTGAAIDRGALGRLLGLLPGHRRAQMGPALSHPRLLLAARRAAGATRVLLVLALRDGAPIAGALNLIGADALYGRYWGCARGGAAPPFRALLLPGDRRGDRARPARVEAGAQGAHKLARGYRPVPTFSAHYLRDPRLARRGRRLSRRRAARRWRARSPRSMK